MEKPNEIPFIDFIKENHVLLEVLGVFGALIGIFILADLSYLTVISLCLFILILIQLIRSSIRKIYASLSIFIFYELLALMLLNLSLYILIVYNNDIKSILPLIIFVIVIALCSKLFSSIRRKIQNFFETSDPKEFWAWVSTHRRFFRLILIFLSPFFNLFSKKMFATIIYAATAAIFIFIILFLLIVLVIFNYLFVMNISSLITINYDSVNHTIMINNTSSTLPFRF